MVPIVQECDRRRNKLVQKGLEEQSSIEDYYCSEEDERKNTKVKMEENKVLWLKFIEAVDLMELQLGQMLLERLSYRMMDATVFVI